MWAVVIPAVLGGTLILTERHLSRLATQEIGKLDSLLVTQGN